jgi:hypothetical protein
MLTWDMFKSEIATTGKDGFLCLWHLLFLGWELATRQEFEPSNEKQVEKMIFYTCFLWRTELSYS